MRKRSFARSLSSGPRATAMWSPRPMSWYGGMPSLGPGPSPKGCAPEPGPPTSALSAACPSTVWRNTRRNVHTGGSSRGAARNSACHSSRIVSMKWKNASSRRAK
ncbi:hypothetical protein [Corynebacterium bovis]|uniref:hypothetical protein n=1 Tax=Corynebacterium bovis TaxID=36808 RepID=UPI00307FF649